MRNLLLTSLIALLPMVGLAQQKDLPSFLKTCAWGTAIGAGAGVVSLAFQDEPGKHTNAIARGASLGLYAGIAIGLLSMNEPTASRADELWSVIPSLHEGQLQGAAVLSPIFRF